MRKHLYLRTCELCGKKFLSKSHRRRYCYEDHYRECPHCGESILWNRTDPFVGCKEYVYKLAAEKRKVTMTERYGAPTTLQSKELTDKMKSTMIEKYGVDNALKSEKLRTKYWKETYGVENPMQVPEIAKKSGATRSYHVSKLLKVIVDSVDSNLSEIHIDFYSRLQKHQVDLIPYHYIDTSCYDFCISDRNLLIDVNPTVSNSIVINHDITRNYHVDKTNLANQHNMDCLHVWDWDNWDRVIQLSCPQIEMQSEEFQVFRLNVDVCNQFLSDNDYRPAPRNQVLCLGLVKDQEIYQVMTFGKAKYQQEYVYQIYRVCTKLNYNIIGGYDRLSSEVSKQFDITSCIAYADVSKPWIERCYEEIGMKLQKRNQPNLLWSKDNNVKWDYIEKTYNTDSESKMIEEGWLPIYDCGTDVYVFK